MAVRTRGKVSRTGVFIIFIILVIAFTVFNILSGKMYHENYGKAWIVSLDNKPHIFLYSTELRPGKRSAMVYHMRIIDPISGKVKFRNKFTLSSHKEVGLQFYTSRSIWFTRQGEFICFKLPSLKRRFNRKQFKSELLDKHPEIGTIHKIAFDKSRQSFAVENTVGDMFYVPPVEFDEEDENGSDLPADFVVYIKDLPPFGKTALYPIPQRSEPERAGITIETFDDTDYEIIYYPWENLCDRLAKDTGFAKNYAVFTPDSTCLLLDGNKQRVIYVLAKDTNGISRKKLMDDKIWLKGEFLRPFRDGNNIPDKRYVTTYKEKVFINWHTSLDEKEDKHMLTAVNYNSGEEKWTLDMSTLKIKSKYRPLQSRFFDNILVTLWSTGGYFYLTGINVEAGEVIWKFRE